MSCFELNFTIELTLKLKSGEVEDLSQAFDLGRAKSMISPEFIKRIYSQYNKQVCI